MKVTKEMRDLVKMRFQQKAESLVKEANQKAHEEITSRFKEQREGFKAFLEGPEHQAMLEDIKQSYRNVTESFPLVEVNNPLRYDDLFHTNRGYPASLRIAVSEGRFYVRSDGDDESLTDVREYLQGTVDEANALKGKCVEALAKLSMGTEWNDLEAVLKEYGV